MKISLAVIDAYVLPASLESGANIVMWNVDQTLVRRDHLAIERKMAMLSAYQLL